MVVLKYVLFQHYMIILDHQSSEVKIMEKRIKYPRSYHLPWSLGRSDDDKVLSSVDHLVGKEVIISLKLDGENTTMYSDYIHARSLDSASHPSQTYVKSMWAKIKHMIPTGWRICGENVYATHSIHYTNLSAYFYVFSIWDENNTALSWDDTKYFAKELGFETVPVVFRGIFEEKIVRNLWNEIKKDDVEGYVVRVADSFKYNDFSKSLAKFVREGHVQPNEVHWRSKKVVPNELKK